MPMNESSQQDIDGHEKTEYSYSEIFLLSEVNTHSQMTNYIVALPRCIPCIRGRAADAFSHVFDNVSRACFERNDIPLFSRL